VPNADVFLKTVMKVNQSFHVQTANYKNVVVGIVCILNIKTIGFVKERKRVLKE
jgi:hypothetical protein